MSFRVKPVDPNAVIRDPHTMRVLSPDGDDVPDNIFWRRRVLAGEVVIVENSAGETIAVVVDPVAVRVDPPIAQPTPPLVAQPVVLQTTEGGERAGPVAPPAETDTTRFAAPVGNEPLKPLTKR